LKDSNQPVRPLANVGAERPNEQTRRFKSEMRLED